MLAVSPLRISALHSLWSIHSFSFGMALTTLPRWPVCLGFGPYVTFSFSVAFTNKLSLHITYTLFLSVLDVGYVLGSRSIVHVLGVHGVHGFHRSNFNPRFRPLPEVHDRAQQALRDPCDVLYSLLLRAGLFLLVQFLTV